MRKNHTVPTLSSLSMCVQVRLDKDGYLSEMGLDLVLSATGDHGRGCLTDVRARTGAALVPSLVRGTLLLDAHQTACCSPGRLPEGRCDISLLYSLTARVIRSSSSSSSIALWWSLLSLMKKGFTKTSKGQELSVHRVLKLTGVIHYSMDAWAFLSWCFGQLSHRMPERSFWMSTKTQGEVCAPLSTKPFPQVSMLGHIQRGTSNGKFFWSATGTRIRLPSQSPTGWAATSEWNLNHLHSAIIGATKYC